MSRKRKPARLWLRPAEYVADGKLRKQAVWCIKDGERRVSTGLGEADPRAAEEALGLYLASRHAPEQHGPLRASEIPVADVANVYLRDVAPGLTSRMNVAQRMGKLLEFWGEKRLSDINGRSCREYLAWRTAQMVMVKTSAGMKPVRPVKLSSARRELADLRSAVNWHRKEGLCRDVVEVVLPPPPDARDRWLTRSEAAKLLWTAWRWSGKVQWSDENRFTRRHIARFILVGLYTGTRHAAICNAGFVRSPDRGWIDLERGIFHRKAGAAKKTKKRQPAIRLPQRLLAHLERWERLGISKQVVCEYRGKPVKSVKGAFASTVADAGLGPGVTPHVLRHSCATWLMQAGVLAWDAAGYLGMSVQVLEDVYGHHHPDHLSSVARAFDASRRSVEM